MSTNVVQKATGASPSGLTDSLIFDNGTNVGIGTTSPGSLLDLADILQFFIQPASPVMARTAFRTDDTGWQYRIAKKNLSSGTITDLMTVVDSGNVGIGTTTPATALHIYTNSVNNGNIAHLASLDTGTMNITVAGSGAILGFRGLNGYFGSVGGYSPGTSFGVGLWGGANSGTPHLLVNNNGNVGIGTTTPDAQLHIETSNENEVLVHVSSGEGGKILFDGADNLRLEVPSNDATLMLGSTTENNDPRIDFYCSGHGSSPADMDVRILAPGQSWAGTGNNLLRFLASVVEIKHRGGGVSRRSFRMQIDESDDPGDGRYAAVLSLNKDDNGQTVLEFAVAATELGPGDGIKMKLDEDGILTIGNSGSSAARILKFRDSGGSSLVQHEAGGGLLLCTDNSDLSPGNGVRVRIAATALSANSALYTASDGTTLTTTAPSSREYKSDIVDFSPDITQLFDLKLKAFKWKLSGEVDCGFLAEDIAACLPDLFRRDESVTGWRADRFPLYLFEALKALKHRVDLLEASAS